MQAVENMTNTISGRSAQIASAGGQSPMSQEFAANIMTHMGAISQDVTRQASFHKPSGMSR